MNDQKVDRTERTEIVLLANGGLLHFLHVVLLVSVVMMHCRLYVSIHVPYDKLSQLCQKAALYSKKNNIINPI